MATDGFKKLACDVSLRRHGAIKDKTMLRFLRIILATPLYLAASLLLLISLRIFPPDLREKAKDSFI